MSEESNGNGTGDTEDGRGNRSRDPDVLLDVPNLKVEELHLELDDLRAHVSLRTELAGFVKVDVGVDAYLNHVKLGLKGADAQAILKVRLEKILDTFNKALATMDKNPELVFELIRRTGDLANDMFDESFDESRPDIAEYGTGIEKKPYGSEPENITSGARKKAEENGLEVSQIEGTGIDGRILVRDVERALMQQAK